MTIFCSCQKDKVHEIKEIYYRPLSIGASGHENQNEKEDYKTMVIVLLDNDSGFVFDDVKEISKIDEIVKNKISLIKSNKDILSLEAIIHSVKRKQINSNNFMITIDNKTSNNTIVYKCNLTNNNELKSKLYLMDKGDTIPVVELGDNDTTGIYYFKKWQSTNLETKLDFPKYNNSIKRDITNEKPLYKKSGKTYEEEIYNFIKVQKLPLNGKPIIDKYLNNKLAIELTYTGPTLAGSEVYFNIKILDKMIYREFQTRGSTNIYYANNRPLSKKEQDLIINTLKYSEIKSDNFKLPVPEIKNNTQSLDLFIKYNNKVAIGGLLYPVKLTRSLENNYPNRNPYEDVAKITSTLDGNTDTLVKVIKLCFEKLDSLNYAMYGIHK